MLNVLLFFCEILLVCSGRTTILVSIYYCSVLKIVLCISDSCLRLTSVENIKYLELLNNIRFELSAPDGDCSNKKYRSRGREGGPGRKRALGEGRAEAEGSKNYRSRSPEEGPGRKQASCGGIEGCRRRGDEEKEGGAGLS